MTVGGLRVHLLFLVYAYFNHDKLHCYALDYFFMGVPPKYQNRYRYRKSMGFTGLVQPIPLMFSQKPAIAGTSLEVEEEELLRHLIHRSLEEAGQ